MSLTLLTDHFADIEDPRQASKVTYQLFDVLFLTLTAVISGAEGWEEIEDSGHLRLTWLKKYGDFNHGIPAHDTIARLVCRIDPQAFHQRFIQWMQTTASRLKRTKNRCILRCKMRSSSAHAMSLAILSTSTAVWSTALMTFYQYWSCHKKIRSTWSSLKTIGRATYYRVANGKEQLQYRYYISSAELPAAQFASTVRAHWGIENRLHWVLDVTMREDDCPISRGHAADNLACFRHVALNQIRREKTIDASVNRKQKMAAMSEDVLDLIVNA